jgi:hypothetical protein
VQPAFKSSIRSNGQSIAVEVPASSGGVLKPGTELSGFLHGNDALVLVRAASDGHGYIAGTIGALSIAEILGHIVGGMKTGKLTVTAGTVRKTVHFREGQIVFAASTQPHERLGKLMVRLKMISADELKSALAQVKPGKKIGQVLTGSGRVQPSDLYSAMTFLVREISISLFELTDGAFFFLDGPLQSEDILKLPERTRTILLEGMKRAEDVQRLRRRVAGNLKVGQGPGRPQPGTEHLVLSAGTGKDLAALRPSFEGGEYAFLCAVDELLRTGALVAIPEKVDPPTAVAGEARSPVEMYAALIKAICDALKSSGKDLMDLQSFFSDPLPGMEESFAGVTLSDQGDLDFDRVIANTGGPVSAVSRARAYEALDGFVWYALFSAKNAIAPEMAEALSNELRRIQSEVS